MCRPAAVSFGNECAQEKPVCGCVCVSDCTLNVFVQKWARNTKLCTFGCVCPHLPISNV